MNLVKSRIFVQRFTSACEDAESSGQRELDISFLFNDEEIPSDIIDSRVTISKCIKACIQQWNLDPTECQIIPFIPPLAPLDGQLAAWFMSLLDKSNLVEARVRRRFYHLLFYKMKKACDTVSTDGIQMLTQLIWLSKVPFTMQEIHDYLPSIVDGGERYSLISEDLGGPGVLFLLPEQKGDSNWLAKLPKGETARTKEKRTCILNNLRDGGIISAANGLDAHAAARKILKHYLERFDAMVSCIHGVSLLNGNAQGILPPRDSAPPLFDPPDCIQTVQHELSGTLPQKSTSVIPGSSSCMQGIKGIQHDYSGSPLQDSSLLFFDPSHYMQTVPAQPSGTLFQDPASSIFDPSEYMQTVPESQHGLPETLTQHSASLVFDPSEYMQAFPELHDSHCGIPPQDSAPSIFDPSDYMQTAHHEPSEVLFQGVSPLFDPSEYMQVVPELQPPGVLTQDSATPIFDPSDYMQAAQVSHMDIHGFPPIR
ncbi:hypothetical protein PRK78_002321 [Emydomyces testavorans]|uniref:Uncharacterized protein n=1 Tax=Emydomyces testavorans TaxID=2070801 RepID=A0AAF0DDY3_9EURO|nr:hypothetical protein PRK78_002321 [Emydomyces testavorans]